MKSLVRTITILITINLITAGSASSQPAPAPTPTKPSGVEALENALQEETVQLMKDRYSPRLNIGTWLPQGDSQSALVIPTSEMKAEDLATIVEDMTVMARIFDKQLGQEQTKHMWFSGNFMGYSSRTAENMYLQGYGALFLKKVDFPLSPGPTVPEKEQKTKKEEAVDPIWEQMRREIYEPQEDRRRRPERDEEKYDAEKVEKLKTNLIKALKHAANMRNLKLDESVILSITGSGDSSKTSGIAIAGKGYGGQVIVQDKKSTGMRIVTPTPLSDLGASSHTMLIIRAKKSDIDAFAKGESDFDKFRQRVQIFTCPYLSGEAEYGDSYGYTRSGQGRRR